MDWRKAVITAGLGALGASGIYRALAPLTRGLGAILTFHHVRSTGCDGFAPNRLLTVTPEFLDLTIRRLRALGLDIVTMDEALRRLSAGAAREGRFAVLTFDDGFRDNLEQALPVLERHRAPGTFYITPGFADRTARLWWMELEESIRRATRIEVSIDGEKLDFDTRDVQGKRAAFDGLYWRLRRGPEERLLQVIGELCQAQGVDSAVLAERNCLDWSEVERLAANPLVTIGAHTLTHPMLAKHGDEKVRRELAESRMVLEARLGRPVRHLAYPVGDITSAGPREYAIAAELGYASAVTTRPGLLFTRHRSRLTALPRVSMNGHHQSARNLDVLLSGAPFLLWNKGRRVVPA